MLAALAFAAPQAVLAQINVELVGNTGQTQATDSSTAEREYAQAFTTGTNATGYRLTGVDVDLDVSGTDPDPDLTIQIWSADATGNPNASVATLTGPTGGLGTGTKRFGPPSGGTVLDADTTYFVVLDLTAWGGRKLVKVTSTASDDEDSGGAAGWSIADSGFYRTPASGGGTWTDPAGAAYRIAIHGRERDQTPPALSAAKVNATSLALVYNEPLNTTPPAASAFAVTVSYTVPSVNPIQDPDGNEAAALTNQPVTIDTTPPTMTSAVVEGTTRRSQRPDRQGIETIGAYILYLTNERRPAPAKAGARPSTPPRHGRRRPTMTNGAQDRTATVLPVK